MTDEGQSLLAALEGARPAEEQVRLRGLAAAKFGAYASTMYFTPDMVELSSHPAVAEYKLDRVLGMGVVLVEPMMTRPPGPDGGHDPESYGPPLSWALEQVRTTGCGSIRLPPGLAPGAVPDLGRADEAEWISYDGEVQELVLWFGLGPGGRPGDATVRRATLLPAGASLTARGLPEPAVRPLGRYLYRPDPAVVHAGLVAEVAEDIAGGPLEGGGTLLTSDELRWTPFATAYDVTEVRDAAVPPPRSSEAPRAPRTAVEFAVTAAAGPVTLTAVAVTAG
ncbi:hypothetical protein [Streptomyces sp. IMTB 1903]|uniref:hypothetical protein n=1 Tax=Streptomyces sp. IMTB 1903 TaxID=1776680 RepID=UPI00131C509C|nr:hypothetical protein [Streptomyces sp. IMTB 1903]